MDYKEKLRLAKEALDSGSYDKDTIEYIFPELKESEDERIRKELKHYLEVRRCQTNSDDEYISCNHFLAWLEKQGKPLDKPVFDVEDKEIYQAISIGLTDMVDDFGWSDFGGMPIEDIQNWLERKCKQKPFDYENANIQQKDFAPKVEHLIPQEGMYYTCIKDYYAADNTHLHIKGNVYKSPFNGYVNNEAHLGLSWNSYAEKYFEPTKDEDWIVCEHDNVIGKPMQYKEFKNKEMQRFIENLKAQGLTPKLRLWNLLDAQNGDVLLCEGSKYGQEIGIVKEYIGKYGGCRKCFKTYCFIDWDGVFRVDEYMGSQNIHPATKEQRNTLMTAMAGAGYTFDFDKKVLKKIEKSKTW